jgi:hypothetical protein
MEDDSMVDLDSRPDLRYLLAELNNYKCDFVKDDQIVISIPQFQQKTNEEWYGIALVCRPGRTDIGVYVCFDGPEYGAQSYLTTIDNKHHLQLSTIIDEAIKEAKVCTGCKTSHDLNKMYQNVTGRLCEECKKKIRSKY